MDRPGAAGGDRPDAARAVEKAEQRLAQADVRYEEGIAWRNSLRAEDLSWRQSARQEDKDWRARVRDEDQEHRRRAELAQKRCAALSAAAQALPPGTAPESILTLARRFEKWLIDGQ
ncbi:MAG: hypothetical protein JSS29_18085 [Proteobacteria bacterium]|nr:hypothetical protein [Pseudomonadota bacterium]